MIFFLHSIPAWLEHISLAFVIGTLVCRLWVLAPAVIAGMPDQENLLRRLWLFFGVSVAVLFASSGADLFVRAAEMSGSPVPSVFPVLPTVIFRTHYGSVWLIRIAALVLLSIMLRVDRRYRDSRSLLFFMLALGLIISMTESASGHASDAGDFSVAEIADWFHLLGASVWGGGLFVLSIVILPKLINQGEQTAPLIAGVARRFSQIASIAVGIIVLTALYHARVYVGSVNALVKTPYGQTIIAKIVLFIFLIFLGAFNRYIIVPRLQEWAGVPTTRTGTIRRLVASVLAPLARNLNGHLVALRFRRSVRAEAFLMLGVLLCVALLRHEIPARHFTHLEHARVSAAPGTEPIVSLETTPAKIAVGVPVTMTVRMKDRSGKPLQGLAVSHERILHAVIVSKDLGVFAHIHPEDVGRVSREMVKKAVFPLRFTFPKAGEYLLGLDFATADNFYSKTFSISVTGKPTMGKPRLDLSMRKAFGDYRVTLTISPKNVKASEETTLRYVIEKNEKAVTNLAPFLDAEMHLAVVSADLKHYIHVHGVTPSESHASHDHMHAHPPKRFGPEIEADIVFPVKGTYKIFSQVNHQGKTLLFYFIVTVQ